VSEDAYFTIPALPRTAFVLSGAIPKTVCTPTANISLLNEHAVSVRKETVSFPHGVSIGGKDKILPAESAN
jgi:hypothetical protein